MIHVFKVTRVLVIAVVWVVSICSSNRAEEPVAPSHFIVVLGRGLPSQSRTAIKDALGAAVTALPEGTRFSLFSGSDLTLLAEFALPKIGRSRLRDRALGQQLRLVVSFLDTEADGDQQLGIPHLPGAFWTAQADATTKARIVLFGDPVFHSSLPDEVNWSMRGHRVPSDRVAIDQAPSAYMDQIHRRIPSETEIVLVPTQPFFADSARQRGHIVRFWRLLIEKHLGGHLIRVTSNASLAFEPLQNQFPHPVVPSHSSFWGMIELSTGKTQEFLDDSNTPSSVPRSREQHGATAPPTGDNEPIAPPSSPETTSSRPAIPTATSLAGDTSSNASASLPLPPQSGRGEECPDLLEPTMTLPGLTASVVKATASSENAEQHTDESPGIPPAPMPNLPIDSEDSTGSESEIVVTWGCDCPHAVLQLQVTPQASDATAIEAAEVSAADLPNPLTWKHQEGLRPDAVIGLIVKNAHKVVSGTITVRSELAVYTESFQIAPDQAHWKRTVGDFVNVSPLPTKGN